jgi:mediator of RNA polymerase II transcription subunit 17
MESIPREFPISIRSWPSTSNDGGAALPTLIQRVNAERGGFVGISEESLQQEIAEAEAQGADDDNASEEAEAKPDRVKEIQLAREEMLKQLEYDDHKMLYCRC